MLAILERKSAFIKKYRHRLIDRKYIYELFTICDTSIILDGKVDVKSEPESVMLSRDEHPDLKLGDLVQFSNSTVLKYGIDSFNSEENSFVAVLIHAKKSIPICQHNEPITLMKNDIENYTLQKTIVTSYGSFLFNMNAFVLPLNDDRIPFFSTLSAKDIEKTLAAKFAEGIITRDECYECINGLMAVGTMSEICAPTFSKKSLTTHPAAAKLKQELFEKYKDSINDPHTSEKIESELIALDKQWMEGDPGADFLDTSAKNYFVARKKTHLMIGSVERADAPGQYQMIEESLTDGWSKEGFVAIQSESRAGSLSRGKGTALGGEMTKFVIRVFGNTKIVTDDCGDRRGIKTHLSIENAHQFIGRYIIVPGKKDLLLLTDENISSFYGKAVQMRMPNACTGDGKTGYCFKCFGKVFETIKQTNHGLRTVDISSTFTSIAMSAMHGTKVSTHKLGPMGDYCM